MAIVRQRGSGSVVQPLRSQANASRMIAEMRRREVLKVKALSRNSGTKSDPHKPATPKCPCGAVNYVSQLQLQCLIQNRQGPKQHDFMSLEWVQIKPNESYLEIVRFAPTPSHIEQAPQEGVNA